MGLNKGYNQSVKYPPLGRIPAPPDMNHHISVGFNCMDGQYDVSVYCLLISESKWIASFNTKEEAIEFADKEAKRLNIDPNWRDRL